jgi:hypothetical protein
VLVLAGSAARQVREADASTFPRTTAIPLRLQITGTTTSYPLVLSIPQAATLLGS